MFTKGWMKRRLYEFRTGHSMYLALTLSIFNFIVIQYRLLISYVSYLQIVIPSLTYFLVFFLIMYIPLATLLGHHHRKKQLKIEQEIIAEANPYLHRLFNELQELRKEIKRLGEKHHE